MEVPAEVLIHNELLSMRGKAGRLLTVHPDGYYELTVDFRRQSAPHAAADRDDGADRRSAGGGVGRGRDGGRGRALRPGSTSRRLRTSYAAGVPIHRGEHLTDRFGHPHQGGARDDRVADVELLDHAHCRHRSDVADGQAVAGVDREAVFGPPLGRVDDLLELGEHRGPDALPCRHLGVGVGVDLEAGNRAEGNGSQGLQLREIGVEKQ